MLDGRFKANIEKGLRPIGANLRRTGITADHLTALGVVMAAGAAVAIGAGQLRVGLLLLILTGLPDALDGAVAKASGTAGPRGAFFDSVSDRVSDSLLLGWRGLVPGQHPSRSPVAAARWPCWPPRSSSRTSGPRPSRSASRPRAGSWSGPSGSSCSGFGLLFDSLLIGVLWVMLALTLVTAVQRFVKVWRQASVERPQVSPKRLARRRAARATRSGRQTSPVWQRRPGNRRTP